MASFVYRINHLTTIRFGSEKNQRRNSAGTWRARGAAIRVAPRKWDPPVHSAPDRQRNPARKETDMKIFTILASAAMLGLFVTNAAHSAEPKSVVVQFADLDLSKAEGAATLLNRIKVAARKVCSDFEGRAPEKKQQHAACVEFALSNAVASVDRPMLTTYAAGRSSIKRNASVPVASGR
jgi:UrcA family protein